MATVHVMTAYASVILVTVAWAVNKKFALVVVPATANVSTVYANVTKASWELHAI